MSTDINFMIGGEAGQGIQTVGHLLALACREAGLYIMAINDFESRIRGDTVFSKYVSVTSPCMRRITKCISLWH